MASQVITQADWTPADDGLLQQLRVVAQKMIISVAKTGSSKFNQDVLNFQKTWNVSKPMIIKALALVKGWTIAKATPYFVSLKEDGGYGPNTAGALTMVTTPGPKPPTTASAMTLYYANNSDFVAQLVPQPVSVIPPVIVNQGVSQPQPQAANYTAQQYVTASQTYVPTTALQQENPPTAIVMVTPVSADTYAAKQPVNSPIAPPVVPNASQTQVLDFTQEKSPTLVLATPVSRDYKLVAVGIGGLALGGVLFMMLRKKKRAA